MTHDIEQAAVVAVLERYVQGFLDADESALRSVFAPDAVMNGYVGDRLVEGTPEPFVQRVSSEPALSAGGKRFRYEIEHLVVTGRAASAVVTEHAFGDLNFRDHMHLLKRDGVWQIVSKTFSTF